MKKQVLSAAIAAVSLLGFSQASFALAPSTVPDLEIFMSGASAQDKAIAALFNNLCDAGTLDVFKDNDKAGSEGKSHTAYFCTLSSSNVPGLSVNGAPVASANVLFHKRSAGGSAQGVNPLIDGVAIAAMRIDNGNCVLNSGTTWFCNAQGANLTNQVSDAGISDVEPKLFTGPNKPSNAGAVDPAAADAALTVDAAAALLFGVPVSDNLYVALQQAQGLMTGFGGSCAAGEYTEACMPSLSKQQVAELVSGQIKKWSEFKINGVALTSLVSGTYDSGDGVFRNVAPTDTKVHFCKRVDGSGTGAQMYAKFLNNPCSTAGLNPDWGGSNLAGPVKHEVSGSGDMELCLEDFADGENNAKTFSGVVNNADTFTNPNNSGLAKAWAIGMQSTENNASHSKHYRFIKVDGVAPTLENAFRGKYMDWVEQTYQWRNAISQDKKTIIQKIAADAGAPSILGTVLNPGFVHPFGAAGYMAVGTKHTFTDTLNLAAPVMPYSHAVKGSLSNCQVPVIPSSTNANKPM